MNTKESFTKTCAKGLRQKISRALLPVIMIVFLGQMLQAYSFNAPIADIQTWTSGNFVYFKVWDPAINEWKQDYLYNNNFPPSNISARDGVVACIIRNWIHAAVYDPIEKRWIKEVLSAYGSYTPTNLSNNNGVVAGIIRNSTHFAVYDPAQGRWMKDTLHNNGYTPSNISNNDGVVASIIRNSVYCAVYDSTQGRWIEDCLFDNSHTPHNLVNRDGVVAAFFRYKVHYSIYDFSQQRWQNDSYYNQSSYPQTNLSISNATVTWNSNNQTYTQGYDFNSRRWESNPTTPRADFTISPLVGETPTWVWFNDMSSGGYSTYWNLGDGTTSSGDCVFHSYFLPGSYEVTQTIYGPGGSE
ncbi:MAG: PKD domain-containing protein, partial [bacterium]|nr:PKD domain-containing protein [bacterium]